MEYKIATPERRFIQLIINDQKAHWPYLLSWPYSCTMVTVKNHMTSKELVTMATTNTTDDICHTTTTTTIFIF